MTTVSAQILSVEEYAEWASLVAASPDGSIYATAEYLEALCCAAGGRFKILGARRGDVLVAGLPLYETETIAGHVVRPRLLLYYLGPVLRRYETKYPSQQTARNLQALDALEDALGKLRHAKVILRPRHTVSDVRPFLQKGWKASPTYSYVVQLNDLSSQWGRVEQNLRRLVDRCAEAGMQVTNDEDFDSFLKLHDLTMEHHDAEPYLPAAPFSYWFRTLHHSGVVKLFLARLPNGEPVAGQIVLLGSHAVTHTVCAATHPAHRMLGASAFLRWRVFEWLASNGKSANDLTDAALNPVTHFKSQLGGDLVTSFVVQNMGSARWRAVEALQSGYFTTMSFARSAANRIALRSRE